METGDKRSLYDRVGGYDVVAAMIDDLLTRVQADSQIGVFWRGQCTDSKRRHRQLLVDYLCESIGGPVLYTGRDLKTSHEGMGITAGDWKVFLNHTEAVLDAFVAGTPEWDECLEAIAASEAEVVEID